MGILFMCLLLCFIFELFVRENFKHTQRLVQWIPCACYQPQHHQPVGHSCPIHTLNHCPTPCYFEAYLRPVISSINSLSCVSLEDDVTTTSAEGPQCSFPGICIMVFMVGCSSMSYYSSSWWSCLGHLVFPESF